MTANNTTMDKEMQSSDKKSSNVTAVLVLVIIAVVLCLVFSTIAMVLALVTFNNYQSSQLVVVGSSTVEDDKWEAEALAQVRIFCLTIITIEKIK